MCVVCEAPPWLCFLGNQKKDYPPFASTLSIIFEALPFASRRRLSAAVREINSWHGARHTHTHTHTRQPAGCGRAILSPTAGFVKLPGIKAHLRFARFRVRFFSKAAEKTSPVSSWDQMNFFFSKRKNWEKLGGTSGFGALDENSSMG